jgi:hypothetical protein
MAYVLDQSNAGQTNDGNGIRYAASDGNFKAAVPFTPTVSANLAKVELCLGFANANPAGGGNVWAEIWSDNGADKPNVKLGNSSMVIPADSIQDNWSAGAGGGIKKFVWLPVDRSALVSGTKYWIVLNGDFPTTGGTNLIVLLSVSGGSGNGRLLEDAGWGGIVNPFWFKQYYHDGIGIDIDSVASMGNTTGTTLNLSHTNSGSSRTLWCTINTGTNSDIITDASYNSVPMTLVDKQIASDNSSYTYLYCLIAPATGTHNITITTNNGAIGVRAASVSYTGTNQSAQPDNSTKATATGTSISASLTPIGDNCWIVAAHGNEGENPLPGAGTTLRAGGSTSAIGDTSGEIHPAAATSMQWLTSTSKHFAIILASMAPAAIVTTTSTTTSTTTTSTSTSTTTTTTSTSSSTSTSTSTTRTTTSTSTTTTSTSTTTTSTSTTTTSTSTSSTTSTSTSTTTTYPLGFEIEGETPTQRMNLEITNKTDKSETLSFSVETE